MRSAASAWSDILPISAAGAGNPQVVMDADGNAMAIWLQQNSGSASESLWFNRYLAGSGWGIFTIPITVHFKDGSTGQLSHDLTFESA